MATSEFSSGTDIALVIDTTGSMGPYIDNVKANAIDIVNAAFGTPDHPVSGTTRIGIVGFKDALGPDGPGENTDILSFTPVKEAALNALADSDGFLNPSGGGDTPEGDLSALIFAMSGGIGDWSRATTSHKIILFTDAPIKDYDLAGEVSTLAHNLGVTLTGGSITSSDTSLDGTFSFTADSATSATDAAGTGPDPSFEAQIFVIQVGSDSSATDGLQHLAADNNGEYFTATSFNLSDIITSIINLPPPPPVVVVAPPGGPDPDDPFGGGTADADTIPGTPGADSVAGSTGSDMIDGAGANDSLVGGSGDDFIRGDDGNDTVNGGVGDDTVNGNMGDDTVTGGDDADHVYGGQGNDHVDGGEGDDPMVNGNIGDDIVHGGYGNDTVYGGQGNDTIYGDQGNDHLSGDKGNDILYGGAGADKFAFAPGGGQDWVADFNAAEGDTIELPKGTAYVVESYMGQIVIDLGNGDLIGLAGVSSFNASSIVFV